MKYTGFGLLLFVLLPAVSTAQDAPIIHRWVATAVATSLDFHCRAKFGDNEQTFTANPDKLDEKWRQLDPVLAQAQRLKSPDGWVLKATGSDINSELVDYFRKVRQWEWWVRTSKQDFHAKMDFFLARVMIESLGGEEAEAMYDAIPDDNELKQDLPGIVSAGIRRELKDGDLKLALETRRLSLIASLKALGDPTATAIAEELTKLQRKGEFEEQWLKKYRPGLIERRLIEDRKKLFALQETVRSRLGPEKLDRIRACQSRLCHQFIVDYDLAQSYEQRGIPGLAIAPTERWISLLDLADREALEANTRSRSGGTGSVASRLMDLLLTTMRDYQPRYSSDGEPFDYVNPVDIKTLRRQADLVKESGEDYGFIGTIDAAEKVKQVAVAGGQTLVVLGQTGLTTYDLKTGTRRHLLYDLPPNVELTSMAVSKDGKHAYVVSNAPTVVRYDLASGRRDADFQSPEVPRKDAKIAISPNGKLLAVGIFGKINVYDTKAEKSIANFRSQLNLLIYGLEFSSSSRTIHVFGNGPLTYEYDVRSGQQKQERRIAVDKSNPYIYRAVVANGMLAAGGRRIVAAWPEGSSKPRIQSTFTGAKTQVQAKWASVTPDKKHLLSSHGIWDLNSGNNIVRFVPTWNPEVMAMSEDGGRIVIGFDDTVFVVPSCIEPTREQEKPKPEPRTWTDKSGKFRIRATLIGSSGDQVALRKTDGSRINVPISALSDADRRHLRQLGK